MGKITERIEPVNIPGLPPLYRHTIFDDRGEQLPDVTYTYRPVHHRRWVIFSLSILALILSVLLAAANLWP
jgi:hypothetical protein